MEDLAKTISNKDMFSLRINQVLDFLKTKSVMLEKLNAIEIFGGTGQNDIIVATNVKTFEIWEIDEKLKPELEILLNDKSSCLQSSSSNLFFPRKVFL